MPDNRNDFEDFMNSGANLPDKDFENMLDSGSDFGEFTEDNAPLILDIDGKISLDVPEDEDDVPASGIILNKDYNQSRNTILPHSLKDDRFPDIVHFQYINDDDSDVKSELDNLMDWIDGSDFLREDFEIYDEIISDDDTSLCLHIISEYGRVAEMFLTLDTKKNMGDLFEEKTTLDNLSDELLKKFKAYDDSYSDSMDRSNCRMIFTSFLSEYFDQYSVTDWKGAIVKACADDMEDFRYPIHVNH